MGFGRFAAAAAVTSGFVSCIATMPWWRGRFGAMLAFSTNGAIVVVAYQSKNISYLS
jgi:hypothetical protein